MAGDFETRMATHIVCTHYGMDTSENTVPYISKWVESDQDLKEKDSSIINIHDTARTFINVIDQKSLNYKGGQKKNYRNTIQ